jgi:hypothetical protein
MSGQRLRQTLSIMRLELGRTLLSRRGWWVYLQAFAPVVLFAANSLVQARYRQHLLAAAAAHPTPTAALDAVRTGQTLEQVTAQLGPPYARETWTFRRHEGNAQTRVTDHYTDGRRETTLVYFNGALRRIAHEAPDTLPDDTLTFATVFQFYDLRLAIFFGCLGVFVNLFRGEMLDKSLHFYLLTPVRREVLLAGKFLAGLGASVLIFGSSVALQFAAMLLQFGRPSIAAFLASAGWSHLAAYVGIAALACFGYGSLFLAVGLAFRNPIVPAAAVLIWESANVFLPASLKSLSLIYYLPSLCPVVVPSGPDLPPALALLLTSAEPASVPAALGGIVVFAIVLTGLAALLVRRLEISYAVE